MRLLKDMATFQTLQTWTGHNATPCHNLNALPHVLLHVLPYILSEICLVLGYLQLIFVTVNLFKKILIYIFFYKFDGNVW